jgi:dynactin 1
MNDMKASKQLTEVEAKELEGKSRAMLDLNLKLRTSAAKTQVKAIDLELRKLEAQEAGEHLEIMKLFLPEAFHAERDSVLALLRFKRIAFKANLVHGFVKEKLAGFDTHNTDEDVFAACDVLDKLTWIAAMADRFVNAVRSCSVEEFAGFESTLHELEPVERALNGHVDALRRDEIKEVEMAEELKRSIAVMSHLASLHVKDGLASHADDLIMRLLFLQSQLESAATALQMSRDMIGSHVQNSLDEDEEDDEGSASDLAIILNRAEALMNQTRSAKVVVGKTHRSLVELQARSLTLETSCTKDFDHAEAVVTEVATYTRQAGSALQAVFGEEGRSEPFTPSEVASALSRVAVSVFALPAPEAGPFNALRGRLAQVTERVVDLAAIIIDLDNTVEFERAPEPWVARAAELKRTKITEVDTEAELARVLEALRNKDGEVKVKETELEEQSVRIEMLEARMRDASKRASRIGELEKAVHEAKEVERQARREMEKVREEKEKEVERAREEMGRLGEQKRKGIADREVDDGAIGAGARMTMKRQEHQIASLEGAVRYLQEDNHRLRLPPPDSPLSSQATLTWLHEPLTKQKSHQRKRQENLQKEGKDLLEQLLSLASSGQQAIDLSKMPENKLAWRPAKDTSRWKVEKRKEEWEGWKSWRRDVVRMGTKPVPRVSQVPQDSAT